MDAIATSYPGRICIERPVYFYEDFTKRHAAALVVARSKLTPEQELAEVAASRTEVLAGRRLQRLRELAENRTIPNRARQLFEEEIDGRLQEYQRLEKRRKELREEEHELKLAATLQTLLARKYDAFYDGQIDSIEQLILSELMNAAISGIPDANLDVTSLGLEPGDVMRFTVSTLPASAARVPPRGQKSYTYRYVLTGLTGPWPTIQDGSFFVRNFSDDDFVLRSGVTGLWNYYGNCGFCRFLAPGFGFAVVFLQFPADGDSDLGPLQVGTGAVVTLFNNIVQFTSSVNLEASIDGSRKFYGIGFSVSGIVDRIENR